MFRIKTLNVKFSKYQKQSPGGVLQKNVLKIFAFVFNLKFQAKRFATLLKRYVFPKNFGEVLRTPIL